MTKLDEPFRGVHGVFLSSVDRLINISSLLSIKQLSPWDMMLNSHINNEFRQNQNIGLQENILKNRCKNINLWSLIFVRV